MERWLAPASGADIIDARGGRFFVYARRRYLAGGAGAPCANPQLGTVQTVRL